MSRLDLKKKDKIRTSRACQHDDTNLDGLGRTSNCYATHGIEASDKDIYQNERLKAKICRLFRNGRESVLRARRYKLREYLRIHKAQVKAHDECLRQAVQAIQDPGSNKKGY